MAPLVVMGAMMTCSFGVAPSTLVVLPSAMVMGQSQPAATIMDNIPMTNIQPFGLCNSPSNPAGMGKPPPAVPTPCPCMPIIAAPWSPGSPTVLIGGKPALNGTSTCNCVWAGVITFSNPGTQTIMVP